MSGSARTLKMRWRRSAAGGEQSLAPGRALLPSSSRAQERWLLQPPVAICQSSRQKGGVVSWHRSIDRSLEGGAAEPYRSRPTLCCCVQSPVSHHNTLDSRRRPCACTPTAFARAGRRGFYWGGKRRPAYKPEPGSGTLKAPIWPPGLPLLCGWLLAAACVCARRLLAGGGFDPSPQATGHSERKHIRFRRQLAPSCCCWFSLASD